jgi:FtsP/CotA-like multicopper oxidase with cupredoxin domain
MRKLMSAAAFAVATLGAGSALAQSPPTRCARPLVGSVVTQPTDLYSANGALNLTLDYITSTDAQGRTLYCFVTPSGIESPTLHVNPGDTLNITLKNLIPRPAPGSSSMMMPMDSNLCGEMTMDESSVNMHFHGTNTSPTCHSDEVIHTIINSGDTFQYSVKIPPDEPAGLYWYHPHIHGQSEVAVQGGASGAIVVEGLQNIQPAVAGLPSRILVLRDQTVAGEPTPGGNVPSWDLTLNYVPIAYPTEIPAIIQMAPGAHELWRVLNASADSIANISLTYDGVLQKLEVVALDGVATGSQDGTGQGSIVTKTNILLPPAARAEFIVAGPPVGTRRAALNTAAIDTGPFGDTNPARTLALINPGPVSTRPAPGLTQGGSVSTTDALPRIASRLTPPGRQRFQGIYSAPIATKRTLYFSEVLADPAHPDTSPTNFFITVDGATPTLFDPANPPAIVTTQGAVEEWTIQNRSAETHEFHIHQIHFLVEKQNGLTLPKDQQQYQDMVQVPYYSGAGPYPSVTVLMDFRGNITGDFVYHCHILGHEDNGMMAIIRVLPRSAPGKAPAA